jgi:hypothetical protein
VCPGQVHVDVKKGGPARAVFTVTAVTAAAAAAGGAGTRRVVQQCASVRPAGRDGRRLLRSGARLELLLLLHLRDKVRCVGLGVVGLLGFVLQR